MLTSSIVKSYHFSMKGVELIKDRNIAHHSIAVEMLYGVETSNTFIRSKNQDSISENKVINGKTTLMITCKNGHKDVVQLLMDNPETNIDLIVRRYVGMTALMFAQMNTKMLFNN